MSQNYPNPPPQHIGIIMDGNGRWAKTKGKDRLFGHRRGVETVSDVIKAALEHNIRYLTFFSFSTENWRRPKDEIDGLFKLINYFIDDKADEFLKENIRFQTVGDIATLPEKTQTKINNLAQRSQDGARMTVCVALNYGGRADIVQASKKIATLVKNGAFDIDSLDEAQFQKFLYTSGMPDPELIIRTSGEQRISNFMLWQIAYSELYFTDILWPDFDRTAFAEAIDNYQKRTRRLGNI